MVSRAAKSYRSRKCPRWCSGAWPKIWPSQSDGHACFPRTAASSRALSCALVALCGLRAARLSEKIGVVFGLSSGRKRDRNRIPGQVSGGYKQGTSILYIPGAWGRVGCQFGDLLTSEILMCHIIGVRVACACESVGQAPLLTAHVGSTAIGTSCGP